MFSDTHFHFKMMAQERGVPAVEVLAQMAAADCKFGLDIGTHSDDLSGRIDFFEKTFAQCDDAVAAKARKFIFYSAGIWPDVGAIKNRQEEVKKLETSILAAGEHGVKIAAIGEGGLDHHWNPAGADGRTQDDFTADVYNGEKELFMMQLELAKRMNLPFIVHSRDAFADTLECIKNVGYNKGIIHCYSYGIEEARAFLDLGWHIAFGGSTTYTKKSKMEDMISLLRFVPEDRLLCETDAPYLAPVPFRGQPNTPVLVRHVYDFVAQARGVTAEKLSEIVDKNIKKLFVG